ncbi:G5 domain-containing protein [Romboutsia sedimentorum]|uniref:G5 domain-containing protein n=1 Tax=Romboutsia sedimentorum TaxID=1368474 RepID=A0ABT7EA38_9FIRM|nr:3D domain-containing protein [Romboutsia sedimentorum]MDK2563794.1 G5 domain-containing protein [Romboutsia sedimentorum]MDK2585466.1 G5 domain-containing protein [Romboutsia sedimentorum]
MKEGKIITISVVGVLVMGILLGGYWTLKKEQLNIVVKGEKIKISSFQKTVKGLLDEEKIKYDEDDEISPALDTKLTDYMNIKVTNVNKVTQKEYDKIPFEVNLVEDKNIEKGNTKLEQEGKEGKKELVYELIYNDDELVNKELIKENIVKEPTNKIVKKGIKEDIIVASRESNSRESDLKQSSSKQSDSRQMSVVATAYAGDSITSMGTVPKWGTIAVDPSVIPYGSKIYIPKFGMSFIAEDCGGAIKGNRIDIFMNSESQAQSWGRQSIEINVAR